MPRAKVFPHAIAVRLTDAVYRDFLALAAAQRRTPSEVLRELVEAYMADEQKEVRVQSTPSHFG